MATIHLIFLNKAAAFVTAGLLLGSWQASAQPAERRLARLGEATPGGLMLFRSGDLLHGRLDSMESNSLVRWSRPDIKVPIEVSSADLQEILLHPSPREGQSPLTQSKIHLAGGDHIFGRVESADAAVVVLDTWYAGKMTIAREAIEWIAPGLPGRAVVYEGPTGVEDWTVGKVTAVPEAGEWSYQDGAFYATQAASIARDMRLPDVASIQFEMAWKGMLQEAVALYTDTLQPINLGNKENEPPFGGFYSLQINSFSANLLPVTQAGPMRYLDPGAHQVLTHKNSARFEIRISKPKRLIALMVDGEVVKQWIDAEGFVGTGTAIRLVHQGQGSVRLSNLRIAEWDGSFDTGPQPAPDGGEDQARLRNGDSLSGRFHGVRDERMEFEVNGTRLEIPMDRVRWIEMAGKNVRAPSPGEEPPVRLHFVNGGHISLNIERWDNEGVFGSAPGFGSVMFNPSAFQRIEFRNVPAREKE